MPKAFSVDIEMPDGRLDGVRFVYKSNRDRSPSWYGKALVCTYRGYTEARDVHAQEYKKSGVYILIGKNGEDDIVYIGKASDIKERLQDSHNALQKKYWQQVIVFVSNDESRPIDPTLQQYLEHHLVKLARKSGWLVENEQYPKLPAFAADSEENFKVFLEHMLDVLSVINISAFPREESSAIRSSTADAKKKNAEREHDMIFSYNPKGCVAYMFVSNDGGFWIQKESTAWKQEGKDISRLAKRRRQFLLDERVLAEAGNYYRFTEDTKCGSPSAAAEIISGNLTNGRDVWKYKGKSLKEWEEQKEAKT